MAVYRAEAGVGAAAPAWRSAGSDFVGFSVDSFDEVPDALTALGAPPLTDHQVRPWGCRFVAQDPDGRPVEINQRDHCT